MTSRPIALALVLLALTARPAPLHAARTWQLSTADATYRCGTYGSLRLDAAGEPHMSSWAYGGLRHTWHDAAGWHGEFVPYPASLAGVTDPAPADGLARLARPARTALLSWLLSSIAIDPAGRPHIAWTLTRDTSPTGPTYTSIWYATRSDTGWVNEPAGPEQGEAPSLDFDATGRPYIAYSDTWPGWSGTSELHVVTRALGAWSVSVVDPEGWQPSLRVDPRGVPHVAYAGPGGLRYATWTEGAWDRVTLDPVGGSPSLAFGPDGEPRIAYIDAGQHLAYAEHHAGGWTFSVADSASGADIEPSLALSLGGEPRIACRSLGAMRPWFAERNGGVWSTGAIDPAHDGYEPQCAVDVIGRVFVAYQDPIVAGLRWAEGSRATGVGDGFGPPPPSRFAITAGSPVRMHDGIALRIAAPTAGIVRLDLFDVAGRRVASTLTTAPVAGEFRTRWTVEPPRPGMYLVRARDANGSASAARVSFLR